MPLTFPRLVGYRFELPTERLSARFTRESRYALSTADIPTVTENAPIVGEKSVHTLDEAGDLTLIIEVSGEARKDKAAKVAAARTLWVPAVNNHGGFGRWGVIEVTDPWDAKGVIRRAIAGSMTPA